MKENQNNAQRQEIIELAMNDFATFCSLFIKIKTKNLKILPFSLNKEQIYIHNQIQQQLKNKGFVRSIIVKSRQVGVTSYCVARMLYNLMYNFGKNGACVANYAQVAESIRNTINTNLEGILEGLKPEVEINNSNILQFKFLQSSLSYLTSGTSFVGRSQTLHYLHGTEVAYWQNGDETIASLFNAVPNSCGTEIILESTSKGSSGVFYNLTKQALENKNDFQVIFLPWFWQNEYSLTNSQIAQLNLKKDNAWVNYQKLYGLSDNQLYWAIKTSNLLALNKESNGPCNAFKREYPASLQEAITSHQEEGLISQEKLFNITSIKKDVYVNEGKGLILGVDVARSGKDHSHIIDRTDNCLGYFVNKKIKTNNLMSLCNIVVNLIKNHNVYKVCIDTIGLGAGVYDRLIELGYEDTVIDVNVAKKANNSTRYANQKAELWFNFKDFIENKARFIVDDEMLKNQILATKCFYNSLGKVQIENKTSNSLWSSPDAAEAAMLTFKAESENNTIVVY